MNDKKLVGIIITGSLLFIGIAYFVISGSQKQNVRIDSYSSNDIAKPKAVTEKSVADLGSIKVSEQKSHDFLIRNSGNKALQLSQIVSSCMCTSGQIIYQGKASQEFGMHSQDEYVAQIAAKTEATVRVTYRPYLMPVYGFVEREVRMLTNDPANPNLVFKITANVK